MNTKILALAGLLSLAASAALADTVSATLASPVAKQTSFITDDTRWTCTGATCTTTNASEEATSTSGCRNFTREVGAVTKYDSLDEAALTKCNAGRTGASAH